MEKGHATALLFDVCLPDDAYSHGWSPPDVLSRAFPSAPIGRRLLPDMDGLVVRVLLWPCATVWRRVATLRCKLTSRPRQKSMMRHVDTIR